MITPAVQNELDVVTTFDIQVVQVKTDAIVEVREITTVEVGGRDEEMKEAWE